MSAAAAPRKGPPLPVLRVVRPIVIGVVLSLIFSLAVAPYFASSATPDDAVGRMEVQVANFDAPNSTIAGALTRFLTGVTASGAKLPTFKVVDAPADVAALRQRVVDGDAWAAIGVNAGAAAALQAALAAPSGPAAASYIPASALTFIWDEGRNPIAATPRVGGPIRALLTTFGTVYANATVASVYASGGASALGAIAASKPTLLTQPIGFREDNVSPATIAVGGVALTVGNILMVVFSFSSTLAVFKGLAPLAAPLSRGRRLAYRSLVLLGLTAAISGCYASIVVGLAGSVPGGSAGWAQIWSTQWLHMMTYVWYFAAVATVLSPDAVPLFLLFAICWGALGGWNTDLAPAGFRFFYYAPMWSASIVVRRVLFGSLPGSVGMAVGILVAWAAAGYIAFVVASFLKKDKPAIAAAAPAEVPAKAVDGPADVATSKAAAPAELELPAASPTSIESDTVTSPPADETTVMVDHTTTPAAQAAAPAVSA